MEEIKWNPYPDNKPPSSYPVLITLKWDDDDYEVEIGEYWGTNLEDESDCDFGRFDSNVIAWAKLPEPYIDTKGE